MSKSILKLAVRTSGFTEVHLFYGEKYIFSSCSYLGFAVEINVAFDNSGFGYFSDFI
jgi:hypothetical protein